LYLRAVCKGCERIIGQTKNVWEIKAGREVFWGKRAVEKGGKRIFWYRVGFLPGTYGWNLGGGRGIGYGGSITQNHHHHNIYVRTGGFVLGGGINSSAQKG